MKLLYSIYQSLDYLKLQIERGEAELKNLPEWEREAKKDEIQWLFERALAIIRFAEPNEVNQDLIDWFLDRREFEERPDIEALKKKLQKQSSRNWLQIFWDEIWL